MIKCERLTLRKLVPSDITQQYLDWLNDEKLQYYTRRHNKPTTMDQLEQFIKESQYSKDLHLAMITEDGGHIGNIFLNNFDTKIKQADLSIMIGEPSAQGKGYAQEAINGLTKYVFEELGLERLYACSPNQAFNRMIEKVGWQHTITDKNSFDIDGKFYDLECWEIKK